MNVFWSLIKMGYIISLLFFTPLIICKNCDACDTCKKDIIFSITGNMVDVINNAIYPAEITVKNDLIVNIRKIHEDLDTYILPGLIDAHVHIESSQLCPSRFASVVIPHGTVATVSDPHEIANVMGMEGFYWMLQDSCLAPLKIFYTAPSCVPATSFETSGATLGPKDVLAMLSNCQVAALGEMMNYPGVINGDPIVMEKIKIAQRINKPIDGHAPGVTGKDLDIYINAGISIDHECRKLLEAQEKIKKGMIILIRQGSAAQDMQALIPLVLNGYDKGCFVTDDIHGKKLQEGHVNLLLRKAVAFGVDPILAVKMVTLNPVKHYKIPVGLLRVGDFADMVIVDNLKDFNVLKTFINGKLLASMGNPLFDVGNPLPVKPVFDIKTKSAQDFSVKSNKDALVNVINVIPNQLETNRSIALLKSIGGQLIADPQNDILKMVVCSRYGNNNIGIGFIKGFEIKKGAFAASVAHDSHNIIAIGIENEDITKVVNTIINIKGGFAVTDGTTITSIPLPVAGLMSNDKPDFVINRVAEIEEQIKRLGCKLQDPLMTLSFMALLVIPKLKLSDEGLFDGQAFSLIDLIVSQPYAYKMPTNHNETYSTLGQSKTY